jgi:hypothetical protein
MGFLQPLGALLFAAVAIPPLLHLLGRRRPAAVVFPAVRYLTDTARQHSRRLRLRNRLLLALRMLIVALVALAAARPVIEAPAGSGHQPTALAVVVDNSLSSGAVIGDGTVLDSLIAAARAVFDQVRPDDELWLVTADGVPRRLGPAEAREALGALAPAAGRLDLEDAVRAADRALVESALPSREVVVVSDLQASALSAGEPVSRRVLVLEPPALPANLGVDSAVPVPAVWTPDGQVAVRLGGAREGETAVRLTVDGVEAARAVGVAGQRVMMNARATVGWHVGVVSLDADELRADDRRFVALRGAPVPAVRVGDGAGLFVAEAVAVLVDAGRAAPSAADRAGGIVLGDAPGPSASVVFPPADSALVGAVNRALQTRGVEPRFGPRVQGEWRVDSGSAPSGARVFTRHRVSGGIVLASVGGEPWIVRDGTVLLVASRMDTLWTDAPLHAGFVPFVDDLARGAAYPSSGAVLRAAPGSPVTPPAGAATLLLDEPLPVTAGEPMAAPPAPGVYYFVAASGDTVHALEVNHDTRESRPARATAAQVRAAFGRGATIHGAGALERELFGGARRAELSGLVIVAAVVLLAVEMAVGTWGAVRAG